MPFVDVGGEVFFHPPTTKLRNRLSFQFMATLKIRANGTCENFMFRCCAGLGIDTLTAIDGSMSILEILYL